MYIYFSAFPNSQVLYITYRHVILGEYPKEQHGRMPTAAAVEAGLNVLPWSDDRHTHHRATALINARLN